MVRLLSPFSTTDSSTANGSGTADFEIDMEVVSKSSARSARSNFRRPRNSISGLSLSMSAYSRPSQLEFVSSSNSGSDDNDANDSSTYQRGSDSVSSGGLSRLSPNRTVLFTVLVGSIGLLASTLFLGFGISSTVNEQENLFRIRAGELATQFIHSWEDYETSALWVHHACGSRPISRLDFLHVYEYLTTSIPVVAVEWVPRVRHEDRAALEQEARAYYHDRIPSFNYTGFVGLEPINEEGNDESLQPSVSIQPLSIQPRSNQSLYYPIHLVEPLEDFTHTPLVNNSLDFDFLSWNEYRKAIREALVTWKPVVVNNPFNVSTSSFSPNDDDGNDEEQDMSSSSGRSFRLLHPGIPLSIDPSGQQPQDETPKDIASLVIQVEFILQRATRHLHDNLSVYIYDSTAYAHANDDDEGATNEGEPDFLVAAELYKGDNREMTEMVFLPEISLQQLKDQTVVFMETFSIDLGSSSSQWTISVVALEDTFQPNIQYIILSGKFILMACLCMSLWIYTNMRRTKMLTAIKRQRDNDKAAMILLSARKVAKGEQELNDYIAHEVRNPVAAAMSACAFVKSAVNEANPMSDPSSIASVREDVEIIDSSLAFTNDLLRSMLDMHRAASKKINITLVPVDLLKDILQPVAMMLYKRDMMRIQVKTDCPENLIVMSDRLRLKQIVLNLGRNAMKFVRKGYVQLRAEIVEGNVRILVEDSGFGIPLEKRSNLFAKFQESLDMMEQGTGMGLCLCKHMTDVLEGDIWLDATFESGVEGFPGTRFVVDLKVPPLGKDQYETLFLSNPNNIGLVPSQLTTRQVVIEEETEDQLKMEEGKLLEEKASASKLNTSGEEPPKSDVSPAPQQPPESAPGNEEAVQELPESLAVLFVDDDMILRKLFTRSLRRVAKTWDIQEASNGETALQMVESKDFDLIFMDQYMSSIEKQLLGTEATRALRSKGVSARICGLSANDVGDRFINAGADFFMFKPFPCKPDELRKKLVRILYSTPDNSSRNDILLLPGHGEHSDSIGLLTQSTTAPEESKS